jgi:hypothetical protein
MKTKIALLSFVVASLFAGASFAQDKPAEPKQANCCAKAKAKGEPCTHACCVAAAKEGKNCTKCGGSGDVAKEK